MTDICLLSGYVKFREICQIGRARSFEDLANNMSPKVNDVIDIWLMTSHIFEEMNFLPHLTQKGRFIGPSTGLENYFIDVL